MTQNEVPTAKVFVLKDNTLGDPDFDWKVCLEGVEDIMVVVQDCKTFEDAWAFLYRNYKRK